MVESSTADARSFLSFILCLGFLAFRVVDFTFIVLNALVVVGVVLVGTVCLLSIILSRCSFLFETYMRANLNSVRKCQHGCTVHNLPESREHERLFIVSFSVLRRRYCWSGGDREPPLTERLSSRRPLSLHWSSRRSSRLS